MKPLGPATITPAVEDEIHLAEHIADIEQGPEYDRVMRELAIEVIVECFAAGEPCLCHGWPRRPTDVLQPEASDG